MWKKRCKRYFLQYVFSSKTMNLKLFNVAHTTMINIIIYKSYANDFKFKKFDNQSK